MAPFKALSQNTTPGEFTWIHFTFYDDWLDTYSKQLNPSPATIRNPGASYDSLRRVIQTLNIPDARIEQRLLQKVSNAEYPITH